MDKKKTNNITHPPVLYTLSMIYAWVTTNPHCTKYHPQATKLLDNSTINHLIYHLLLITYPQMLKDITEDRPHARFLCIQISKEENNRLCGLLYVTFLQRHHIMHKKPFTLTSLLHLCHCTMMCWNFLDMETSYY